MRASGDELEPEQLVDTCLDLMGPLPVRPATKTTLVEHATKKGTLNAKSDDPAVVDQRVTEMLQLIVATREFQFG